LNITEDISEKTIEYTDEILIALALENIQNKQVELPKSMVPNLGWFDRDRTKFEDWWKEI